VLDAPYRPLGLLAELTYRCPLHCPYCSNPVQWPKAGNELTLEEWKRVMREASEIGVLHVSFSGGEPLLFRGLPQLVQAAREAGLYTNLLTSALGWQRTRALQLLNAGLDCVQVSFQADEAELADSIAGMKAHEKKLAAARMVREMGFPLTINVVLHRGNIDRLSGIIALAEQLDAQRLELAHTQYYGWAFQNRQFLLPTRAQVRAAAKKAQAAQQRLCGKMEILYVLPDYYGSRPKPCMYGWGQRFLIVNPAGDVLPCQTASEIPLLRFDNVRDHSLRWIWTESAAFNKFRGTAWMPEPCRSCERRELDFGGCRCQAFLLTGDAANTDPVCALSPHHQQLVNFVERSTQHPDDANFDFKRMTPSLHFRTYPAKSE
jgi:pyrroloquinoline quinone biosynthesis protein E